MKYKTIKELPGMPVGTIFDTDTFTLHHFNHPSEYPDFFEPIKESKVWKPDEGEEFYKINELGSIVESTIYIGIPDRLVAYGSCYKTKEEAIKARDKQLAVTRCKHYLIERGMLLSDEEVMDNDTYKYTLLYNNKGNRLSWGGYQHIILYSPFGYINSQKNVEQFIKDCEKDLLLIYLP